MRLARGLLKALRPKQWTKNLVVFAALLFAQRVADAGSLERALAAFVVFCGLSASIYLINDVLDVEQDRAHPAKRWRAIASGACPIPLAIGAAAVLGPLSLLGAFLINTPTGLVAAGYVALTLLYNFIFKQVVILDVLAISIGFVLRAIAGATAISVEISPWLLICTILLALFLALSKRRQELIALEEGATDHRPILAQYSPALLDQMISLVTASTLMSYCLYTIDERTITVVGTHHLMYTIPFVIYGLFRYLYLVHQRNQGSDPSKVLLTDGPLLIGVFLYVVTAGLILYLAK